MIFAKIIPPSQEEWNTAPMPAERRAYLDRNLTFEEIAVAITTKASYHQAKVCPYRDTRDNKAKTARQIIFQIETAPEHCDLFYNSRDGLRGRYWRSPDIGLVATNFFIKSLLQGLLNSVAQNAPTVMAGAEPMSVD